ncbi:SepM family pheromone-processing serine protease [Ectobacillus sp. sgz5001026]|uniref:SepM family pheromone-processing serine protease n=1 Tax=Ectobacillus sp. sgz5001026 TaxID=3242473 RepID=UPI0036D34BD1
MRVLIRKKFLTLYTIVISICFITAAFIPTPYYLYQPGPAEAISPKVTVENGHKSEAGNFYLTTVLSIKARNVYDILYGLLTPHTQIRAEQDVQGTYTSEEYASLLNHMMLMSQQNAIAAALRQVGEPVTLTYEGVFVSNVVQTSKAKGIIKPGDIITSVDTHPIQNTSDFMNYIATNKKVGQEVQIGWKHEGIEQKKDIELISIDASKDKPGLGILPEDQFTAKTGRNVSFQTEDIGGPSAGFMFSLEIVNQLTNEDLTKGYKIAGTGTIDVDGNIGQIGGIRDKIIAAHDTGIDIFFCPKDQKPGDNNTKDILDEAAKQKYSMKIIPVATLKDAITYLQKSPVSPSVKK